MRRKPNKYLEGCRVRKGPQSSDATYRNNGVFVLKEYAGAMLVVVASDGGGWDHVSVHVDVDLGERTPTWDEMCFVKEQFFKANEWVMQLHPPVDKNVNVHNHTLHLWRPQKGGLPTPPRWMV